MDEAVRRETGVQGLNWNSVHGGYFADPAVAHAFVSRIMEMLGRRRADVVVDLAGGTGFILGQLLEGGAAARMRLVDLDCSEAQLAVAQGADLECLSASITEFVRRDVARERESVCWIMRSALHYVGREGLLPLLPHLRRQASPEEHFVHQTACFERGADAACLNLVYEAMNTRKWYPMPLGVVVRPRDDLDVAEHGIRDDNQPRSRPARRRQWRDAGRSRALDAVGGQQLAVPRRGRAPAPRVVLHLRKPSQRRPGPDQIRRRQQPPPHRPELQHGESGAVRQRFLIHDGQLRTGRRK